MKLLLEIKIKSKIEMHDFGTKLAKLFSLNDLITFDGDLGVGKTFICKSIITNSGSWRFFDSQSTETNGDDAKATLTLNIVKTTVVKQKNKALSKVFI